MKVYVADPDDVCVGGWVWGGAGGFWVRGGPTLFRFSGKIALETQLSCFDAASISVQPDVSLSIDVWFDIGYWTFSCNYRAMMICPIRFQVALATRRMLI